jgi:hypothetical protein
MDLETVSQLVTAHASPETLKREKSLTKKAIQQRMYQSFKWGMIFFILGMASLAATKTLGFDKIFNLGPLFLLFLGMGIMLFGALSPMRDQRASQARKVPDPRLTGELHEAEATKELASARVPVPVPSITERTTQLIANKDLDKSRE